MPTLPRTLRVDEATKLPLSRPRLLPNGFWRLDGFVSRPGVYSYRNDDGTERLELRPDEEVFHPESLASFETASVTDGHPKEAEVTSGNVRKLEVGTVMGPGVRADDADGPKVAAPVVIKDAATIRKVKAGKQQLSPGYLIDLEERGGVHPKYGKYHAIQRNIRVNHLAIVDRARGGDNIRFRMDGVDDLVHAGHRQQSAAVRPGATMDPEEQIRTLKAQVADFERLAKTRQDEADSAVARADRAEAAIEPLNERILELETMIAAGATEVETEAVKRERHRADQAEAALRRMDEAQPQETRARANLMHRAGTVLGPEFRMDDLSTRQIHSAVVKKLAPSVNIRDVSDAFLEGRFETLMEIHGRTARSLTHTSHEMVRKDQVDSEANKKAERLKDFRNQWRKPLPNDIRAPRGEGNR